MVVTGWTRPLSAELLGVPPRGVVGFHASLLPRYRGRAPVNWAILRGEAGTGNTMMYLDAGTDTGDIIDQQAVPITPTTPARPFTPRSARPGPTCSGGTCGRCSTAPRPGVRRAPPTARRCRSARPGWG